MAKFSQQSPQQSKRSVFLRALILIIAALGTFAALVLPLALRPATLPLAVGDVASRNLDAPYSIEYISEIRTEEARQTASLSVALVYTLADPSIAREQIGNLRSALLYIATIRADEYASPDEKAGDLRALAGIALEKETIITILGLSDAQWERIQQEALSVLEQVMRNSIRQGDLASVQRSVSSRVSLALTDTQAQVVAELARAFVMPNSLYSEDLTEASRKAARDAVNPIIQKYKIGERVVSEGQVVSTEKLEALEVLGLIQTEEDSLKYVGAGVLVLTLAVFLGLFFSYRPAVLLKEIPNLVLLVFVFLVFLIGARLFVPNHVILPYLYPLPAFALLVATLFGAESAFVLVFALSLLSSYDVSDALSLSVYYLLPSLISILVLGKARQAWAFLKAGFAVSVVGIAILAIYWLPFAETDSLGAATLATSAAFNGLASASLALLLHFFLAQILGLPTSLRLLEISRPDAPLLQFLLRSAPGTYQHSLQVANLAEQAAESIGADALLVRVGALFHDVGKAQNPLFFIENQTRGSLNTHEDLAPADSAAIIIRHVSDGVALARKYRLPKRLIDFILEHHGTRLTRYQYMQALKDADGELDMVDMETFRYPGPAPRSRETALLMLADGVEAATRAERPAEEADLRSLVYKIIDSVQKSGQLEYTHLSLRDISLIRESFVSTLRGTLHPRVKYPKEKGTAASGVATKPRI